MRPKGLAFWLRAVKHRTWVQLASALITNSWFTNQVTKGVPCLALNCYACPWAATACPIGSLQHFVAIRQVPLYLLGLIGLAGVLGGRLACGWLCPFGWLQELIHKLPVPKWTVRPRPRARWWWIAGATVVYGAVGVALAPISLTKGWLFALYLVAGLVLYGLLGASRWFSLLGLTLILPAWLIEPWFCKICPAGMLEGGIPQVIFDPGLRPLMGPLFGVKLAVLAVFLAWMAVTRRPFCRWVCPLGALWALSNRWSALQMQVDQETCIRCDRCQQVCPVDIRIYEDANPGACIRCMRCIEVCPVTCISVEDR